MEFWIKAAQLLTSLSILVVLHELGHFIPARLFGTRVEKFYLFFNPGFSLFKIKKGETEYGIGWLPLGGYVKISGMVDESLDAKQLSAPAEPWEFRAKPAWQRLIIMVGGVTVNLILGMLLYAMILYVWGDKELPNSELQDGVWCVSPVSEELGFRNGDKIQRIRGEEIVYFHDIVPKLIYSGRVELLRNGAPVSIEIPENVVEIMNDKGSRSLFYPRVPFIVSEVPDSSINAGRDLMPKDEIVSIHGIEIRYFDEARDLLNTLRGQTVEVGIKRGEETLSTSLAVSDSGQFQVKPLILDFKDMERTGVYHFDVRKYSFLESIPAGLQKAWEKLSSYVEQFKLIFNPDTGAYKSLGGFGRIGGMFPASWEWESFWEITAILSLILAFMNILPIPALDGGHVMFLLYEIAVGKAPNQKFLERAQIVGMVLLLMLLVYANGNDLVHWLKGTF